MEKTERRTAQEQSRPAQLRLPLRGLVREALFAREIVAGLEYVGAVLEEERSTFCGPRYQHDPRRQALRAGSVASALSLGGRSIGVSGRAPAASMVGN